LPKKKSDFGKISSSSAVVQNSLSEGQVDFKYVRFSSIVAKYFITRYEEKARENLRTEIEALTINCLL
jgi:hypothetical protein